MPLSPFRSFARLPKSYEPTMPDHCVGCFAEHPRRRVTLWTLSSSWWTLLTPLAFLISKATRKTFPACGVCSWRMRFRRLGSTALMLALIAVAVWGVSRATPSSWPRLLRRAAAAGAGLVLLLPWAWLETRFPPVVQLNLDGENLQYEFREIEFAAEFRLRNDAKLLE